MILLLAGCMTMDGFFFANEAVDAYVFDFPDVPSDLVEEVSFASGEDTLYGVWAHQEDPDAPVLLYFHGNTGNLDTYNAEINRYWTFGYETFSFDFRGYGKSEGTPTWEGLAEDGLAAVDYVSTETGLLPSELPYLGLSLGGSVATRTAGVEPPAVLITESMFASGEDLIDDGSGLGLPPGWLLEDEWDNTIAIAEVHVPVLVMHGEADEFIQVEHGREVYAAANDPKELWIVPGADHSTIPDTDPAGYEEHVTCWIAQTCIPE